MTESKTLFSPLSSEAGDYPLSLFTAEELEVIWKQTEAIISENEWITPLIPETIIRASIKWLTALIIEELLIEAKGEKTEVSLEDFQKVAEKYLVTYNLKGAEWFKNAFEEYCLEKLQESFADLEDLETAKLQIIPIRVSSSEGLMSFGEANVEEWDPDLVKGKNIISLDDIGDRGKTQEKIREIAMEAGALSVTTVNLTEKMVPDDVGEDKRKTSSPDIALLKTGFYYLLGWGLDDGKREATRDFESIVVLSQEIPETAQLYIQGKLKD